MSRSRRSKSFFFLFLFSFFICLGKGGWFSSLVVASSDGETFSFLQIVGIVTDVDGD